MNYILQGLGVFLGVIVGTVVTILVQLYFQQRAETQKTRNLKFELDCNIEKIGTWLEELACYRNALNGDSLHMYFGYFDISRILSVTANDMYQSGLLYKKLSQEQIGQLQAFLSEFTAWAEQSMNNQFNSIKQTFEGSRAENQLAEWATL